MKKLFLFLALTAAALAQTAITLQPNNGATIPGSQRKYYGNVTGTTNLGVNWTITGNGTLSSTTGTPVVVTSTGSGAACTFNSVSTTSSFASTASYTVTATAQDTTNGTQTASTTVPICQPSVVATVFPAAIVLYKNQYAILQSNIRGSINTGASWSITTNPGSHGTLTGGSTNRFAVFSADTAGTYVVRLTSAADGTKQSTATIYVTANTLPASTPDFTEPVDPTAVGSGTVYEVGPSQTYTDLNAVPINSLTAGDTVRIHNEAVACGSPTEYHNKISIPGQGTRSQPIRIVGVPDACGNKPIIDGSNATTRSDANWAGGFIEAEGLIITYDSAHKFDNVADGTQNIVVEGLHIRNIKSSYNYLRQSDGTPTPYDDFGAAIRVQTGSVMLMRGNWFDNIGQGIFINSVTPLGSLSTDMTVQGNAVTQWGVPTNQTIHAMYLQAIGLAAQFNYFGVATNNPQGNVIKTRSVLNFIRWNYIGQPASAARGIDLVEPQAFNCYVTPYDFAFAYRSGSTDCQPPNGGIVNDNTTADEVAANYEAYHSDYAYGNVFDDTGSGSAFYHYNYDQQTTQGAGYDKRGGTFYSWNNTHYYHPSSSFKVIFDMIAPDQAHSYEFATVQSINNVYSAGLGTQIDWVSAFQYAVNADTNFIQANYYLPNRCLTDSYVTGATPTELASCDAFGNGSPANGHMTWARNGTPGTAAATLYISTTPPFNTTTFVPDITMAGIARTLPSIISDQPSSLEFYPATARIALKSNTTFLGALEGISSTPGSVIINGNIKIKGSVIIQ